MTYVCLAYSSFDLAAFFCSMIPLPLSKLMTHVCLVYSIFDLAALFCARIPSLHIKKLTLLNLPKNSLNRISMILNFTVDLIYLLSQNPHDLLNYFLFL